MRCTISWSTLFIISRVRPLRLLSIKGTPTCKDCPSHQKNWIWAPSNKKQLGCSGNAEFKAKNGREFKKAWMSSRVQGRRNANGMTNIRRLKNCSPPNRCKKWKDTMPSNGKNFGFSLILAKRALYNPWRRCTSVTEAEISISASNEVRTSDGDLAWEIAGVQWSLVDEGTGQTMPRDSNLSDETEDQSVRRLYARALQKSVTTTVESEGWKWKRFWLEQLSTDQERSQQPASDRIQTKRNASIRSLAKAKGGKEVCQIKVETRIVPASPLRFLRISEWVFSRETPGWQIFRQASGSQRKDCASVQGGTRQVACYTVRRVRRYLAAAR